MADLPQSSHRRREYLDWYRGAAVLLMILSHLLDAWTRMPDRHSALYRYVILVGGTGTSLFLLLAGVSVGLSAGSKLRRHGQAIAASNAVAIRGLEIFALAFLFRLQAWIISGTDDLRALLRVDILNIMGPSIVAAALLWRLGGSARGRAALFAAATLAVAFLTPVIRAAPLGALPDPVEAYVVPVRGLSNFVFFPWMGLLFAGAATGVVLDTISSAHHEARVVRLIGAFGALIALAGYLASYLPPIYAHSEFWTSSPTYFFVRVGIVLLGIAVAFGWNATIRKGGRWSPVVQLGRTSLFIYWIHVELVYGVFSRSIHRSLTITQALGAFGLFTALMVLLSVLKERAVRGLRWRVGAAGESR